MTATVEEKKAEKKAQQEPEVALQRVERTTTEVLVRGTAPLIVHKWSDKAKKMILDKQMGQKNPKENKDPQQEFEDSMHRFADGGHGFPAAGFKAAIVGGARYYKDVTMVSLRRSLFLKGEGPDQLVRLVLSGDPKMREDMVRVGQGTADIRYRAEYPQWEALLTITYVPSLIDLKSIVALVDAGGMGGIGEWRPENDGIYGTFEVVDES